MKLKVTTLIDLCVPDHPLSEIAIFMVERRLRVRVASTEVIDNDPSDAVLNFLNPGIFRGGALDVPNMNFHPATPAYPGRGGASRALYDGVGVFGATAHRMERRVDAGEIYFVSRFPVTAEEGCASLFARAEAECLGLLGRAVHVLAKGEWPSPVDEEWGTCFTRKRFEAWMAEDAGSKADALAHPRYG